MRPLVQSSLIKQRLHCRSPPNPQEINGQKSPSRRTAWPAAHSFPHDARHPTSRRATTIGGSNGTGIFSHSNQSGYFRVTHCWSFSARLSRVEKLFGPWSVFTDKGRIVCQMRRSTLLQPSDPAAVLFYWRIGDPQRRSKDRCFRTSLPVPDFGKWRSNFRKIAARFLVSLSRTRESLFR